VIAKDENHMLPCSAALKEYQSEKERWMSPFVIIFLHCLLDILLNGEE